MFGKKTSLLLIVVFLSIYMSAQNVEIVKDTYPIYQGIVKVDSKASKQIYSLLKEWTAVNFKSAKDVIQLDDPNNGKIIIKGLSPIFYKISGVSIDGVCQYMITLDIKDNKYRYTIDITDVQVGTLRQSAMDKLLKEPNSKPMLPVMAEVNRVKDNLISSLTNIKEQPKDNW